jgi:hypothetical protein
LNKLTTNASDAQNIADNIGGGGAKTCITIAENSELYAIRTDRMGPDNMMGERGIQQTDHLSNALH